VTQPVSSIIVPVSLQASTPRMSPLVNPIVTEFPLAPEAGRKPTAKKDRQPSATVVDLIDALRWSVAEAAPAKAKPSRKPRKAAAGQMEMLMPIPGKSRRRRLPRRSRRPSLSASRHNRLVAAVYTAVHLPRYRSASTSKENAGEGWWRLG